MKQLKNVAESLQSCVSVSVTDLRIGNYYSYDTNSIKLDGSFLATYLQNDTDLCLYPIPLTEDWILKFEIGKQNGYPYKFLNGYLKIRNGIYFFKYYELEIELPFVHSLQNLHYTLNGSELQIGNLTAP